MTLLPLWVNGDSDASTSAVLVPDSATSVAQVDVCSLFPIACTIAAEKSDTHSLLTRRVATATEDAATDLPAITPDPTPTPEPLPTMAVRQGDTLVELAGWFGITPFDIASTNGFAVDDYLQIGWTLAIPVSAADFSVPPDPMAGAAAAVAEIPAPAATPAPTPVPVTAAPYIPPSSQDVIAAICSLPWPCEKMVRIASCESGLNPRAVNPIGYYGLFQISNFIDGWDDALTNATFAYYNKYLPNLQSGGDGLAPWPVCKNY